MLQCNFAFTSKLLDALHVSDAVKLSILTYRIILIKVIGSCVHRQHLTDEPEDSSVEGQESTATKETSLSSRAPCSEIMVDIARSVKAFGDGSPHQHGQSYKCNTSATGAVEHQKQ